MDASRAEIELEAKKLRTQVDNFEHDLKNIRGSIRDVINENETLRRELRRTVEERLPGVQPTGLLSLNNDSLVNLQKKQLDLLEKERDDLNNLYEQSKMVILQLQEENSDLRNPLKPHLIKLQMENRQAQEDQARVEVELLKEMDMIRDELAKRSRELVNSQLTIKELERENENLENAVARKQDELRSYLKKEMTNDARLLAFQSSIDEVEVRFEQALREKATAEQEREEMETKLKNVLQQNRSLDERLHEAMDRLQDQSRFSMGANTATDAEQSRIEHERMHRTIDELIQQAAMKARDAVEEVRQQYNDNLDKIMQEYNRLEAEFNQKELDFDKCLRAKRLVEEELDKILQERRFNLEKSTMDHDELAKRCFHAERERDEIQLKFEQTQQALKITQESFNAEKLNYELKRQELNDRVQKVSQDLNKMTADYTATFDELNELKKKYSSIQNEQNSMQRRMTDLVKRHEEGLIEKEKDCLQRLTQRDEVNRTTFNELRNLVGRQQRMIVKYKEECHHIASQCETKISEYKSKIDHLRTRNEQLQSDMADIQRKDAEMNRILSKNANRIKSLEERLKDAEEQAIEASRRVAKQLVRDRLAIMPSDHYAYSANRPHQSTSLINLNSFAPPLVSSTNRIDSIEHASNGK